MRATHVRDTFNPGRSYSHVTAAKNLVKTDHLRAISEADLLAQFQKLPGHALPQPKVAAHQRKRAGQAPNVAGTLRLKKTLDETPEQAMANAVLMPPNLAAVSLHQWQHGFAGAANEVDINQLCVGLAEQLRQVCEGSFRGVKSRLLMQSAVLDAMFFKLNTEVARNIAAGGSLELSERLLKLAFRAQSQSRATDETLAFLEHPKALFIKQQNNAAGHQQVLNSRARKMKPGSNKLLDDTHDERMDTRAPGAPVRRDPAMAAVDAFDRATNARGKGNGFAQRVSRGRHSGEDGGDAPITRRN
jgi:hypothetical protein